MGPTIGNVFWRVTHGANLRLIEARDREFYNHIVKNRANPAAQSATNPVPDYYGKPVIFKFPVQVLRINHILQARKSAPYISIDSGFVTNLNTRKRRGG